MSEMLSMSGDCGTLATYRISIVVYNFINSVKTEYRIFEQKSNNL